MWNVVFSVIFLCLDLKCVACLANLMNGTFTFYQDRDSIFVLEMNCDILLVLLKLRRGQQP